MHVRELWTGAFFFHQNISCDFEEYTKMTDITKKDTVEVEVVPQVDGVLDVEDMEVSFFPVQ